MVTVSTGALGFGRMGPKRELKFALEKYWRGDIDADALLKVANSVEESAWDLQVEAGIDKITVGDYCLYDSVLTWCEMIGIVPKRFTHMESGMDRMFGMANGVKGSIALKMKKWITSNYHYLVPEVDESLEGLKPNFDQYLMDVKRGVAKLGQSKATPFVMGPVSMIRFCDFKNSDDIEGQRVALMDKLIPVYKDLLSELKATGVSEIQIHEPALVFADDSLNKLFEKAYPAILAEGVGFNLVSFMEDVGDKNYQWIQSVKEFSVVSLDFTRGDSLGLIKKYGFSKDKTLGAGVLDARNVWKMDPSFVLPLCDELKVLADKIRFQPSSNLQFNPWDLDCETDILASPAGSVLSFSKQKLTETADIAKAVSGTGDLEEYKKSWDAYRKALSGDQSVGNRVAALTEKDFARSEPYKVRRPKQLKGLPQLATSTIGSFPQTKEIRSLRLKLRKGLISKEEYEAGIDQQIAFCIGIQKEVGLDIFVHGEPERTDMVEFFAQNMDGMLFSLNGWVQSFGNRCARPPIFWNDISRPNVMSTREFIVAQKLTENPVKGMLTGPVTILNWSFPRADISRKDQAMQIALAIRDETVDLEKAGCTVIQVDEPAIREGMPLRSATKDEYLKWAVDAFKLSTSGVKSETQIVTHMCYSEFEDCMQAINDMDSDVLTLENSRTDDSTLRAFETIGYGKGIGAGTYDIHSPIVPPVDFIKSKIISALDCMPIEECMVNPDCGLKTRTWPETIAGLKNMVKARDEVLAERKSNE